MLVARLPSIRLTTRPDAIWTLAAFPCKVRLHKKCSSRLQEDRAGNSGDGKATMSHDPEQMEPEASTTGDIDAAIDASKGDEFSERAEESMSVEAARGHTVVTGSSG